MSISNKKDFVSRYVAGEFGNRTRSWPRVIDFLNDPEGHGTSGWNGPRKFHLRSKRYSDKSYYDLTVNQLVQTIPRLSNVKSYYVSEMVNHSYNTIQGELQTINGVLHLSYSLAKGINMRQAMQRPQRSTGILALGVLKYWLKPSDFDWLQELRQRYVGHVIEFGCFSNKVGVLQTNMIIWEVRNY